MNQPDENPRSPADSPFMGPAVPPRSDATPERDDLPEPLAPFFGPASLSAPDDEGDAGGEIPWLIPDEPETEQRQADRPVPLDEPSYLGGVPEVDIDDAADVFSFDALEPEAEPAVGGAEGRTWTEPDPTPFEMLQPETETGSGADPLADTADAAGLDLTDWESALAIPPEADAPSPGSAPPEPGPPPTARQLHVEQAGGFREAGSTLAHEVADRLERIAHSLRVRAPDELLGGAGDPLEILIIGYVLGASRGSAPGGEQAPTL